MRKFFRRYMPDPDKLREHKLLALFGNTVLAPTLWQLNRKAVAGGVAVGLFCGLIPGPLQMLGAVLSCIVWRVNLPLALATTFYTNPLTIVPLYVLAFGIGRFVTGSDAAFVLPPERGDLSWTGWVQALVDWFAGLGEPLLVGLPLLALGLAVLGYWMVSLAWRLHVWRAARARRRRNAVGK